MKGEAVLLSATATAKPVEKIVPETEVKKEKAMTLEELLAELKTEHDIDVSALQARVTELETSNATLVTDNATLSNEKDEALKLSSDLTEALGASGVVTLSNGSELSPADVIGAVSELAQGHITLSNQVKSLAMKDAAHEVQDLVDGGRVYPTQKDWLVELKLSNPTAYDTFLSTLPDTPAVPINKEVGVVTPEGDAHNRHIEEIARLTAPDGPAYQYINRSGKK
jgi:succinate dehydrogenase/fumarate reductase flavoprotein subunit